MPKKANQTQTGGASMADKLKEAQAKAAQAEADANDKNPQQRREQSQQATPKPTLLDSVERNLEPKLYSVVQGDGTVAEGTRVQANRLNLAQLAVNFAKYTLTKVQAAVSFDPVTLGLAITAKLDRNQNPKSYTATLNYGRNEQQICIPLPPEFMASDDAVLPPIHMTPKGPGMPVGTIKIKSMIVEFAGIEVEDPKGGKRPFVPINDVMRMLVTPDPAQREAQAEAIAQRIGIRGHVAR